MKILYAFLVGLTLLCCGCGTAGCVSSDQKPVAPDTYIDGGSDAGDPQLPPMKPHWKD